MALHCQLHRPLFLCRFALEIKKRIWIVNQNFQNCDFDLVICNVIPYKSNFNYDLIVNISFYLSERGEASRDLLLTERFDLFDRLDRIDRLDLLERGDSLLEL